MWIVETLFDCVAYRVNSAKFAKPYQFLPTLLYRQYATDENLPRCILKHLVATLFGYLFQIQVQYGG
jgi:hypothetical protein